MSIFALDRLSQGLLIPKLKQGVSPGLAGLQPGGGLGPDGAGTEGLPHLSTSA